MAKKKRQSEENRDQLFYILNNLTRIEGDKNECGLLIGYGIIKALYSQELLESSPYERRLSEIRAIYSTLKKSTVKCRRESTYSAIAELMQNFPIGHIDDLLEEIDPNKRLLREIVSNKNLTSDRLRKVGLKLLDDVISEGPYQRTIDALTNNHTTVRYTFLGR
ncbi:MAG: hypothetical protein ISS01_01260 [Nanoarchaeota archaeon]|nr:hypothetical protein [Nanoarchaeota archaeon]